MMKKEFPLYEGLFKVKNIIREMMEYDKHIFVFVAGGSASGKTSKVANNIAKFFDGQSLVLSMDNYFRGKAYYEEHNITYDEPQALNIDLLHEHLFLLKQGNTVKIPDFDFVESKPIPDAITVEPRQIMIIEGLFTLHERFEELADLNIFVETSTNGRLIRRILRDIKRTKQKVSDIIEVFTRQVDPMHKRYIEPQKEKADIVILNEFAPYLEVKNIDLQAFIKEHNIPNFG